MLMILIIAAAGLIVLSFAPPLPPSAPAAGSTPPDAWWAKDAVVVKPPSPSSQPQHFQAQLAANDAMIKNALGPPLGDPNFLANWTALQLGREPGPECVRNLLGLPDAVVEAFLVIPQLWVSIFEYQLSDSAGYVLLGRDMKVKSVIVPPTLSNPA